MTRWLVRRWYVLYWLAFVLVAVDWGRNPGFVPDRELQPYPWFAVLVVSVILALFTAWLGTVIRGTAVTVWVRSLNAVVFVVVLLFLVPWLVVTDGPGLAYVLPLFALVTLLVLLLRAVVAIAVRMHKESDSKAPVA